MSKALGSANGVMTARSNTPWSTRIARHIAKGWKRFWPFEHGRWLYIRLIGGAVRAGLLGPLWLEFRTGLWIKLNIQDLLQEELLLSGVWDPGITSYLCAQLKPGCVFMDIGANVGYFSLLAGSLVGPTGKVIAVEPNHDVAVQLKQNAAKSEVTNIALEEVCCSESAGQRTFFLSEAMNSGKSSLSQANAEGSRSLEIACTTVDLLVDGYNLQRVDAVKVDVEGAEMEVLRGMRSTLAQFRPALLIELLPPLLARFSATAEDVIEFLAQQGYSMTSSDKNDNYIFRPGATVERESASLPHSVSG